MALISTPAVGWPAACPARRCRVWARSSGGIAVKDHQIAVQAGKHVAAHQDGMSGALLLGLLDEPDAGRGNGALHLFSLVTHHDKDALRRRQRERRIHHVPDQRLAARPVEHLGLARFHPRAEAGGKNHHGNWGLHPFHYVRVRPRCLPSCASFTTTSAVAAESWRTLPVSLASLAPKTFTPILKIVARSFSTCRAASRA